MKAMVLQGLRRVEKNSPPLVPMNVKDPVPGDNEILVRVSACGVCHTELDEIEGRTPPPRFPVIPGHQVVGTVQEKGKGAGRFRVGERVGIAWIFSACGTCRFCLRGDENLCEQFRATGRDADGGYAECIRVREEFALPIPEAFTDAEAAPLLCAGAIGYRSVRLTGMQEGESLGLTGFGASAHIVLKMVRSLYPGSKVYVFARSERERSFARELGAVWAGETGEASPVKLDAIIDTTPVWTPVVESLKNLERGGCLIINAIRKEEIDRDALTRLDYPRDLWMEKEIKSVANVSRRDVREFMDLAAKIPLRPEVQEYALGDANTALLEMKEGKIRGAKVLVTG